MSVLDPDPAGSSVLAMLPGRANLNRRGRETRARIVEAASRVVLEQGSGKTTLDDIQRAANVSASQLYHYFDDRHALIRAVIQHQATEVLAAQRAALADLDSFEALDAWRDMMVAMQDAKNCVGGCPLGSLVGDLAETDLDARSDLAVSFERWEEIIRDGLLTMQRRGLFGPEFDAAQMALSLLVAVQGGLLLSQARRSTEPLRVALDVAFTHLRELSVTEPASA